LASHGKEYFKIFDGHDDSVDECHDDNGDAIMVLAGNKLGFFIWENIEEDGFTKDKTEKRSGEGDNEDHHKLCYDDLDLGGNVVKVEILKHEQELGVDVVEEGQVAKHGGDGVNGDNQKQRCENDFHHFSFGLSAKVAVDREHGAVAFERKEESWERINGVRAESEWISLAFLLIFGTMSASGGIFQRTLISGKFLLGDDSNDEKDNGKNGNGRSVAEVLHVSEAGEWRYDKSNE